jgi:hypothetical protein
VESQSSIFAISILFVFPKEYSYEAKIKSQYQSSDDCLHPHNFPFFFGNLKVTAARFGNASYSLFVSDFLLLANLRKS